TGLVHIGDADRLTDLEVTGVQWFKPDDRFEQGRLTNTVRTDHTDDPVRGQRERQSIDQNAIVEALLEVLGFENDRAEPWAGRDLDLFEVQFAGSVRLGGHLLITRQTRLRLRLPALRVHPNPLEFVLESLGLLL